MFDIFETEHYQNKALAYKQTNKYSININRLAKWIILPLCVKIVCVKITSVELSKLQTRY